MPLVRFEVRNEYGLGQGELYKEANREDPKAVLDGVAVSGLVGILRQLGDLAEFAAEVFHGLQEQVMTTASRSHKLMARVQNIEAALPPLEKVVLAQTSHIHFAYTAGSEWHPRIKTEQNHFIYNDLPRFIMDSYEECRDPPRLHLLDKFDTGGPGSCLKRYSDPTFFRSVSSDAKEPDAKKVQKDKRARKSKKKQSSTKNGDSLRYSSMSKHSGSMQFTPPVVNERTSPSHTASTIDMTLKSDLGDHSNSFDSRTGSGYIECVFHLNSTMQPEEQESKEVSSKFMQGNNIPYPVFPDGQPGFEDNNFHHISAPVETAAPSSSCVTWDEKAEIMEPRSEHCDEGEDPEVLADESDLDTQNDTQNERIAKLRNPNPLDVMLDDANTQKSSCSACHLDEVESEPDDYLDALNTIESESENDIDCQTKREVEQLSCIFDSEAVERIHEVAHISDQHPVEQLSCIFDNEAVERIQEVAHISDQHPSKYEALITSNRSTNKTISPDFPNSVPSKGFADNRTSPVSQKSSELDYSSGNERSKSADALDSSKVESVSDSSSSVSGTSVSNLPESLPDKAISSSCTSRESQTEFSGVHSVTFWTNGGLLGLEPSKPPDFAVPNSASQDHVTGSKGEAGVLNHTFLPRNEGEEPGKLVKYAGSTERIPSSGCSTAWHEDQDAKVEKSSDARHSNRFIHAYEDGINVSSAQTSGNEPRHDADVKRTSIEASHESEENSLQSSGFGHRLLVNGFHKKMSLIHDGGDQRASILKTDALEQKTGHGDVTNQATTQKVFNEPFGHKYSIDSYTSSPPLQHMKISFHPIDGLEASKLKLKFPDGSHSHESVRDLFPSFQLVPESSIPLHDMGSDSDDDTFCRSSPYLSEDCPSHHSESDSEQWESGDSPKSKDNELYGSLCRISPVESVSSSLHPAESVHTADPSLSASLDLPCFDAMNPVMQGETKDDLYQRNQLDSEQLRETTPLPPPLPPVQWRLSKSHSDVAEDKQHSISESLENAFDIELLRSTVTQHPKPSPANEHQMNDVAIAVKPKNKQQDEQKLNWEKEAVQSANGKGMEEDFLHQIRAKSISLRRITRAKSTPTLGPTANEKVTAILKKANAIRQVVGSDDGEDDTW